MPCFRLSFIRYKFRGMSLEVRENVTLKFLAVALLPDAFVLPQLLTPTNYLY